MQKKRNEQQPACRARSYLKLTICNLVLIDVNPLELFSQRKGNQSQSAGMEIINETDKVNNKCLKFFLVK